MTAQPAQTETLLELTRMLQDWGARINLTGHRSAASIAGRLVLDAAALCPWIEPGATVADLGSGAGFPGLPLAILRPDCQVLLVEARERRHHFQRAAVRALDLPNAQPERGRAESLPAVPHRCVVAQALARPDRALVWMLPWAAPGGLLLLPGGARETGIGSHPPGVRFVARHRYRLPGGGPLRTLLVARRMAAG